MLRMIWRLVVYLLVLYSCCKLCFVIKMVISSFLIWACHLHCIWDMVVVRGCTIFEGRIARRDEYYISRDVSRAVKVTIIEGRVVRRDGCMDKYVPHGSWTKRQLVCIVKKDMHHYIWHCISWHCTFVIDELEHVFCWSCECFSVTLVTVEYWVVIENV